MIVDNIFFGNLYALGTQPGLIIDIFRNLFFFIDSIIYSLIPVVFNFIYSLYDLSSMFKNGGSVLNDLVKNLSTTIYSFLAIAMFFRTAVSLLTMLVDPSKIADKEKGASKIVLNILLCLVLIVAVPVAFDAAKKVQTKVMDSHVIEKMVMGEDFGSTNENYTLGNAFAKSVWGIFLSDFQATGATKTAYDAVFNKESSVWPFGTLFPQLNTVVGIPGVAGIVARVPFLNQGLEGLFGAGTYYQLSYIWLLSTIVGGYLLWAFIKMMIDIAYRSIKFFALELLSPIAIISYIDPDSSKKGLFSKWLKETVSTYLSLFIRIFVFAIVTILLKAIDLTDIANQSNGLLIKVFYILAAIAFFKNAPKFIDSLFGTKMSQDSDTKFAKGLLGGLVGGAALAVPGGIYNAVVAKATGQSAIKGAITGAWNSAKKGYNAGKKGSFVGVVGAGYDSYKDANKKYGYERDYFDERDLAAMERAVPVGKKVKNDAIARAEANDRANIKTEFTRRGRKVNGFETYYDNLIGDNDAEGYYKKYVATVAETNAIPGLSEAGKKVYGNSAQRSMYAALSKYQADNANSEYNRRLSAFLTKDATGKDNEIIVEFNKENARRRAAGESEFTDWKEMFAAYSGGEFTSATISIDDAYKIAVNHEIEVKTGHDVSTWNNIARKDESDAQAAKDEVKRHEASAQGKADARRKKIYNEAKGKVEAQGYRAP